MPTSRKRTRRTQLMNLNPIIVEAFVRWKELDQRRGTQRSKEGILLNESEGAEYRVLSQQIESQFNLRPWEGSICYSMWGQGKPPTSEDKSGFGALPLTDRVLEIRQRLEQAAENYQL